MLRSRRPTTSSRSLLHSFRVRLQVEELENRLVPAGLTDGLYHAEIVAGDPAKTPTDSPAQRVDANTKTSAFAGVGSIQVQVKTGPNSYSYYIGSASVIGAGGGVFYVLTAGHVVDVTNDNGKAGDDGVTSYTFVLNYGGNLTNLYTISGSALSTSVFVNPDYSGFANPSVNDDVAILKFTGTLPSGVPVYPLYSGSLQGQTITLVGYGQSGDGVKGYTVSPSYSVKRVGSNVVDYLEGQDDTGKASVPEVFYFDFDGPTTGTNTLWNLYGIPSGGTLGNNKETTLGGGDSGGPSFVKIGTTYYLAGVNTFSQDVYQGNRRLYAAPKFGSLAGGMVVSSYAGWIQSVLTGATGQSTSSPATNPTGPGSKKDFDMTEASAGAVAAATAGARTTAVSLPTASTTPAAPVANGRSSHWTVSPTAPGTASARPVATVSVTAEPSGSGSDVMVELSVNAVALPVMEAAHATTASSGQLPDFAPAPASVFDWQRDVNYLFEGSLPTATPVEDVLEPTATLPQAFDDSQSSSGMALGLALAISGGASLAYQRTRADDRRGAAPAVVWERF